MTPTRPTPYTDYLHQKYNRMYASARIRNGELFYLVNGAEVPKAEWEAANPMPGLIKLTKNENIDSTSKYIYE